MLIAPSLLSANFLHLFDEIKALEQAGAHMLHLDVMDGHYVPNLTFGPFIAQQIKTMTNLPLDVHLMVTDVEKFIDYFANVGVQTLTIHPETSHHPYRTLQHIRALGVQAGVALNPGTAITCIEPLLEVADQVLVMTVNPGFSGQNFLDGPLKKIEQLNHIKQKTNLPFRIQVDGGVTDKNAPILKQAGANILVSGSFIFSGVSTPCFKTYQQRIQSLNH